MRCYLTLFFLLGLATLRRVNYFLFFVGIIFPILWVSARSSAPRRTRRPPAYADAGTRQGRS